MSNSGISVLLGPLSGRELDLPFPWAAGIDVERGYYVFGASGALVFAALTADWRCCSRSEAGLASLERGARATLSGTVPS